MLLSRDTNSGVILSGCEAELQEASISTYFKQNIYGYYVCYSFVLLGISIKFCNIFKLREVNFKPLPVWVAENK